MQTQTKKNLQLFLISTVSSTVLFILILIFFAPRLVMVAAEKKLTDVDVVTSEGKAPLNNFSHTHRYPTAKDRIIVRLNTDTFYSSGWFNLNDEPYIIHLPKTDGRYYSIQINDVWTNAFAYLGKRATGSEEGNYAIVGPRWKGNLPAGVTKIVSPTNKIWIIGRIMFNGEDDMEIVTALQEKITATPLSEFVK